MESTIIEIRAGAGGEEAALFAKDLFRMYSKYAQSEGWEIKTLDKNLTELEGIKQIALKLRGNGVFEKMKYEAGVHRVQRVPETEKSNRIHTSTVSVAVLKIPSKIEVDLKNSDIKMDFFKASGHGGQNVNKRQTAVRITHLPSGLVVSSQTQRNLEQNKKNALSILKAKLYQKKQEEKIGKLSDKRRDQIGEAQRAEKIRTYNFPQDRISDHRIGKKFHNIEKILNGDLGKIIKKFKKANL